MAAIGIIGLAFDAVNAVSGAIEAINMQTSSAGSDSKNTATIVVAVGVDTPDVNNMGGDLPDARNFGIHGDFLGMVADPGSKIEDGTEKSFTLGQSSGQQAHYTLFSANDDAICIAYSYMIWPGQSAATQYGMVGTWGDLCGAPWYYSGMAVPGSSNMPHCMWIDANGDQPTTGFQVNWLDMLQSNSDKKDGDKTAKDICGTPSFKTYTDKDPRSVNLWGPDHRQRRSYPPALSGRGGGNVMTASSPPKPPRVGGGKNSTRTFGQKYDNVLIIDDKNHHVAETLCESKTSAGPDFVNPQKGTFCDMKTKTVYPLCNGGAGVPASNATVAAREDKAAGACFDFEAKMLSGPGVRKRQQPYAIADWRHADTKVGRTITLK